MNVVGRVTLMLRKSRRNCGGWERRLESGPSSLGCCCRGLAEGEHGEQEKGGSRRELPAGKESRKVSLSISFLW